MNKRWTFYYVKAFESYNIAYIQTHIHIYIQTDYTPPPKTLPRRFMVCKSMERCSSRRCMHSMPFCYSRMRTQDFCCGGVLCSGLKCWRPFSRQYTHHTKYPVNLLNWTPHLPPPHTEMSFYIHNKQHLLCTSRNFHTVRSGVDSS